MKTIRGIIAGVLVLVLMPVHRLQAAEAEGTIAINPTDHNNMVAAIISLGSINSIRVQYSFNGGAGWTNYGIISGSVPAGDPFVAFDPDGVAFIVYQHRSLSDFVVKKSTNGGVSWSDGTTIDFPYPDQMIDRPWMAISPVRNVSGRYDIFIAHVWEGLLLDSEEGESHIIRLAKSTDGGETFTYPGGLMSPSLDLLWAQGPSIAVGPSGNIYRSWASYDPGDHNAVKEIHFDRSTTGGSSFSSGHSVLTTQIGQAISDGHAVKRGWIRADSYPHIAVDPIDETVYAVWAGKEASANILLLKSTDLGATWSSLMHVDTSPGEQWMPAVSVSPDQVLCILFYSTLDTETDPIYVKFAYSANRGLDFTTSTIGSGFIIPQNATFLGDYQGLTSKLDVALAYYTRGSSPSDQFASVEIPALNPTNHSKVLVDQLDESSQSFEKFGRWNQGQFTNYKPPHRFVLPHNSSEVLRAKQDFKTGTTQKYNQWDIVDDAINHRPFTILTNSQNIIASFKTSHNATIRTELIDGGTGDSVRLQDPWLIDYDDPPYGLRNQGMAAPFLPKLSPFSLSTGGSHKGVVLEQDPAVTPTYYSVRASLTKPINSFTWYFQEWAGSGVSFVQTVPNPPGFDQKAVIFGASGAEAVARYKAHLGSSTTATSTNSQRKLAIDEDGNRYLTYESAGEVWFTESTNGGATWSPELRISNGASSVGSPSGAPSIAVGFSGILPLAQSSPPEVYIVYRQRISPTVPFYNIFLRYRRNGNWSTVQINNPTYGVDLGRDPHPVVVTNLDDALEPYEMYVVWRGGNSGNNYQLHYSYLTSGSGSWEVITEGVAIPNTGSGHLNPSLTSPYIDGFNQRPTFFTYDNGLDVLLRPCVPAMNAAAQYIWQAFGSFSGNSQVAADVRSAEPSEHQVHVVWENVSTVGGGEETQGNATEQRSIMHRRTVGGTLDWATEFRSYDPGEDYSHPTIALLEDGTASWAWDNGQDCFKARWDGSSWDIVDYQPYTARPTLPANSPSQLLVEADYLSMSLGGAPYRIEQRNQSDVLLQIEDSYSRRVAALLVDEARGNSSFSLELETVDLVLSSGERLTLDFVEDTARSLDDLQAWRQLATRAFTLPAGVDSILIDGTGKTSRLSNILGTGETVLRVAFDLLDARTGEVIRRLGAERRLTRDTTDILRIRERLADLTGRDIVVRPSLAGLDRQRRGMAFTLVHVHTLLRDTTAPPTSPLAKAAGEENLSQLPATFALHQNYPNPFNPTTEIRFDLPEAGTVSLVVFDVLGREIAVLVDGYQPAGYHSATWNATDQASGVYFARFTATSAEGRPIYTKINKLILMK